MPPVDSQLPLISYTTISSLTIVTLCVLDVAILAVMNKEVTHLTEED